MIQASCFMTGSSGNQIPLDAEVALSAEDCFIRGEQLAEAGDIDEFLEQFFRKKLAKNQVRKARKAKGARRAKEHALRARSVRSRPGQCECGHARSPACPFNTHSDKGSLNARVMITRPTARIPCSCDGRC